MSSNLVLRGLSTLMASVMALSFAASPVVESNRTDIDKFLGTRSQVMMETGESNTPAYTFTSDYNTTKELLDAIEDVGERMEEEGAVLLKNNGALPLSQEETQHVSLLGFSSYYPVVGGDMGSSLTPNFGTDADTVDFVGALNAKGFKINKTLQDLYKSLESNFVTEINMWGMVFAYNNITAPSVGGVFSSKEPSQALMAGANADWKASMDSDNVMIITIARSGSENKDYTPGTAGVDPSQNLNQKDPLGLSDDERDLIAAAVEAKAANGGKVIVLLNNSSAMEIQELADNDGIDAILQIGLPGGYGFYGVCDILSGAANPSGHLTDTYAVTGALSPAAQNYGDLQWTNPNPEITMNDAIVEAEGIYIGYRYYETRYADTVLGQGNADAAIGSTTGAAWNYDNEVTYPFGFGLSYTTFEQKLDSVNVDLAAQTITAKVTVTNTGDVAGKDVVQLYASVPYTDYDRQAGVEKSAIQLIGYEKTAELAPGASETVTVVCDAEYMASWDSTASNAAGTKGNFILDAGDYFFTVGNGSHEAVMNVLAAQGKDVAGDASKVQTWNLAARDETTFAYTLNGTPVENQLADMDVNYWLPGTATYLSRQDWEGTWPKTYMNLTATAEMIDIMDNDIYEITPNGDPASVVFGAKNGLTLSDLKGVDDLNDERWGMLMDQINLEDAMIRLAFGGTSTKAIESIMSPETIQNDGPNGIYSYPLGQYANHDASSGDPCVVAEDDPNANYKFGTMVNETVIAQTFNKELAAEFGALCGNYSLWANLTIFWGCGTNIHRLPYNARNHEYYSEDPILSAEQGAAYVAAGKKYGVITAVKHFAFNDTEVNRSGVAVFMTEQKARETELRCFQPSVETVGTLGVMTAYNRVGITQDNAHIGLLQNILRKEWGFMGLMSEDFIQGANYAVVKEAAIAGVTMTCNTGDSTMEAVTAKWPYWTVEAASQDATLMAALKQDMTWQAYALANSNAMDGMTSSSKLVSVKTWYDNALNYLQIGSSALTVLLLALYILSANKKNKKA